MPCTDWDAPARDRVEARELIDRLTRMLCTALGTCEAKGIKSVFAPGSEIALWWADHKKKDANRLAREAAERRKEEAKKAALAKLSTEEKAALGLK